MNDTKRLRLRSTSLSILAALLLLTFLLSACIGSKKSATHDMKMAPITDMSADIQKSPVRVREAYQFAAANPDILENVPCYCGCDADGHTSNYACYVKDVKPSGEVIFDNHALGCSICIDITQDAMKMTKEGKLPKEIRAVIDTTYSKYGPSNMPPVQ